MTLIRLASLSILLHVVSVSAGGEPSFDVDVQAVLGKAGCNQGLCHGNQNGKGGFRLSLRGEDSLFDFRQITQTHEGRRINLVKPEESLLLLKATCEVPHQGGQRIAYDSEMYRILRAWIHGGAGRKSSGAKQFEQLEVSPSEVVAALDTQGVKLTVTARFSDGTEQDVSDLAIYESTNLKMRVSARGVVRSREPTESTIIVRFLHQQRAIPVALLPSDGEFQPEFPKSENPIDQAVFGRLKRLRMDISPICDDTAFLRRVYLDVLGILPTADEARQFNHDKSPKKRERLIDEVLARTEYAEHWALKWSDVLRNEEKVVDRKGVSIFHEWIKKNLREDRPWNEFAAELLSTSGSTYENPAANFYRAHRTPTVRSETAARLFLGYRLACAQCHNHPFDRWTQDDYYRWAAVFSGVDYKIVSNKRKDKFDKHEFDGDQIVSFVEKNEVKHPRTGKIVSPALLGSEQKVDSKQRIQVMSQWLTGVDNDQFARVQANWIWYHLIGRGVVEPVDDFRQTNPPSNPELLQVLANQFRDGGFRPRSLIRLILRSQVYQASSRPTAANGRDEVNFSHNAVRRLTAEQLLDAQTHVLGVPPEFLGYDSGTRAGQLAGVRRDRKKLAAGETFLKQFGKPERLLACTCERSNETTLSQVFTLICDDDLHRRITSSKGTLAKLASSKTAIADVVESLFWSALSRAPSEREMEASLAAVKQSPSRVEAIQDLAWTLINSKEFIFRR